MVKGKKLLVFDSHPVQYRVPVWQEIEARFPGVLHVVYATDCSIKGYNDKGFGKTVAWDEPMLEGYSSTILNCVTGTPLSGWKSLNGNGVSELIDSIAPSVILMTGLNYKYDWNVYFQAFKRNIPVWIRCETQDHAVHRSKRKDIVRYLLYKAAYAGMSKFFYIGNLNKMHYIRHGVSEDRLVPARYGTIDRFKEFSSDMLRSLRSDTRKRANVAEDALVVGFSGKFIPKKNPEILFDMIEHLPQHIKFRLHLYFIGSGELSDVLVARSMAVEQETGIKTHFTGFVNQSEIASHYLAMDIMVLPSRRMGETWGLVANEAMQGGCGAIVSSAVGCSADFASWERFEVFDEGSASDLALKIVNLSRFERSFSWASKELQGYTIPATANAIGTEFIKNN